MSSHVNQDPKYPAHPAPQRVLHYQQALASHFFSSTSSHNSIDPSSSWRQTLSPLPTALTNAISYQKNILKVDLTRCPNARRFDPPHPPDLIKSSCLGAAWRHATTCRTLFSGWELGAYQHLDGLLRLDSRRQQMWRRRFIRMASRCSWGVAFSSSFFGLQLGG